MKIDKEDKDRFESIAKELGCDESDDALDNAFDRLDLENREEPDQETEKEKPAE